MLILVLVSVFCVFQERAAGALANLAADDKCSMEVALAGGVHALVMLACNCKFEGVQEQVRHFHFLVAGEEEKYIMRNVTIKQFGLSICISCGHT